MKENYNKLSIGAYVNIFILNIFLQRRVCKIRKIIVKQERKDCPVLSGPGR